MAWSERCEHRLLFAVLEDALRILSCVDGSRSPTSARLVVEARDWVLSDDTQWPFSFRNLCDALEIGADTVQRWRDMASRRAE
jgi:hypothetical protein